MLDKIITLIPGILLGMLNIVVVTEVVMRYFFNSPIPGSSAVALLLFAWIVFITTIAVTKNNDNLSVTFFKNLFPKNIQLVLTIITEIVCIIFFMFIIVSSYQLVTATYKQTAPILGISRAWYYSSMLFSFIILLIHYIYRLSKKIIVFIIEKAGD